MSDRLEEHYYHLPDIPAEEANARLRKIVELAQMGQFDGAHHKTWVIDQVVRAATGDHYERWVTWFRGDPEDEANHYFWDEGVPP